MDVVPLYWIFGYFLGQGNIKNRNLTYHGRCCRRVLCGNKLWTSNSLNIAKPDCYVSNVQKSPLIMILCFNTSGMITSLMTCAEQLGREREQRYTINKTVHIILISV